MRGMKIFGAGIALSVVAAACSGSNDGADGTVTAPATSEKVEESTTTSEPDVIPEIADATRPTLVIPDSDSYNNPAEEVLDRYLLHLQARFNAAGPPIADPDYEPLSDVEIGDAARQTRGFLEQWRDDGVVLIVETEDTIQISPKILTPTFEKIEGATVIVQDCMVDNSYTQDRATGEVLDEGVRTVQSTVELIYQDGHWRVHEAETNHTYEGEESTCPERR